MRARRIATAQIRTPITDGAYGKPWVFRFKDIESWWANAHYDRPGGVESGVADGLGAARQADLADRARLPGGRQGRQPAERVLRSEIGGIVRCRIFRAARATMLSAARYRRGLSALLRADIRIRRIEPGLVRLWRADGRSGASASLGVGRAALSVISRPDRRVVGRRELGARALAERPARRGRRSAALIARGAAGALGCPRTDRRRRPWAGRRLLDRPRWKARAPRSSRSRGISASTRSRAKAASVSSRATAGRWRRSTLDDLVAGSDADAEVIELMRGAGDRAAAGAEVAAGALRRGLRRDERRGAPRDRCGDQA